jgi:hypothetical protein
MAAWYTDRRKINRSWAGSLIGRHFAANQLYAPDVDFTFFADADIGEARFGKRIEDLSISAHTDRKTDPVLV